MIMVVDMLSFCVKLQILNKLNGNSIVAHQFYRIINSRGEIEILEKTL